MNKCVLGLAMSAAIGIIGCSRSSAPEAVPLPPLAASDPTPSVDPEYRLQPGDILRIKFAYHPELDVKLPVRPDGNISLQSAGEILAVGLTAEQLAAVVRQRSSETLRDPEVTVIIADLAERKIYVGGEVRLPGFVPYRRGLTALQAILDRGGFTDTARVDSVVHLVAANGMYQASRVDLSKVLVGTGQPVELAAADMIYVPRTFIGDVGAFVDQYVRRVLPIPPRIGIGFSP